MLKRKNGYLLKRGDGPIDFNWNQRYLVLEGKILLYYKYSGDKTPRGLIKLDDCIVSQILKIDVINYFLFFVNFKNIKQERDYAFFIELNISTKRFYFSGETKLETEEWRNIIAHAVKPTELVNNFLLKKSYIFFHI